MVRYKYMNAKWKERRKKQDQLTNRSNAKSRSQTLNSPIIQTTPKNPRSPSSTNSLLDSLLWSQRTRNQPRPTHIHSPNPPPPTPPPLVPPFLLFFFPLNLDDDPAGRELAYDSGSSAKLIRLGVDRPEDDRPECDRLSPTARVTPMVSRLGRLRLVGLGDGDGGADGCFIADDLGGGGGRVDDVCVALVYRREMEAVAVEVLEDGRGGGERGRKAGGRRRSGFLPADVEGMGGCSSRILRR